jgi:hypothetical protein
MTLCQSLRIFLWVNGGVDSKERVSPLFSSLHISACHEYTMSSRRYIIRYTSQRPAHSNTDHSAGAKRVHEISKPWPLVSEHFTFHEPLSWNIKTGERPVYAYMCNVFLSLFLDAIFVCSIVVYLNLSTVLHTSPLLCGKEDNSALSLNYESA